MSNKAIPQMGDRLLGTKLASAFALHSALNAGDLSELDMATAMLLEESIMQYAMAIGWKAEA
jgi:hypothetical protein